MIQLTLNKKYLFIIITSGVPSVSDPHEAIHGDLNQQIKIGEAIEEDKEDFEEWKRGNVRFNDIFPRKMYKKCSFGDRFFSFQVEKRMKTPVFSGSVFHLSQIPSWMR